MSRFKSYRHYWGVRIVSKLTIEPCTTLFHINAMVTPLSVNYHLAQILCDVQNLVMVRALKKRKDRE